jgi:hypothetical protein
MCDKIYDFKLCTCIDKPAIHNKKSRRNKNKEKQADVYKWTLLRYVETVHSGEMGRVIMPSKDIGEGLTEEFVLEKLNTANCFDFNYTPQDRDSLKIQLNDRWDKYLAFGYENGKWTIGASFDAFNDVLKDIGKGELKKINIDPDS